MKWVALFLLLVIGFTNDAMAESCAPPLTRAYKQLSDSDLERKWQSKSKLPCESYSIAYAFFLRYPEQELGWIWLEKSVEALQKAKDPQRIIQILISSMAQWPQTSGKIKLRLFLLEAVKNTALYQGKQGDTSWAEYFLGIQQSPMPEILAAKFEEDFPSDREALARLKKIKSQVVSFYLKKEMRISQHYLEKGEFLAALFRLEFLLKQNFALEKRNILISILRQIVKVEIDFAQYLLNPPLWGNKWPDSRARSIPGIPMPYSRKNVAKYFLDKAEKTKPENLLKDF